MPTSVTSVVVEVLEAPVLGLSVSSSIVEILEANFLPGLTVTSSVVEVLEAAPSGQACLAGRPLWFFVFRDPTLKGRDNVLSVTSEAGAFPGVAVGADDNQGRLFPLQEGVLDPDTEPFSYLIQDGGGVGVGTFVWRLSSDDPDEHFGRDDTRHWWGWHAPFSDTGGAGSDNCAGGYLAKLGRIVLVNIDDATDVAGILYRDQGSRYDDWQADTFALTNPVEADHHNSVIFDLPDGQLCWIVRIEGRGSVPSDLDVYHSPDGLTWTLVSSRIIERFDDSPPTFSLNNNIRGGRSAEWIRVCAVDSTGTLLTWLSRDRGITWARLPDSTTVQTSGHLDEPRPFDLDGVDDSGSFLLAYNSNPNATSASFLKASQDGDWRAVGLADSPVPSVNEGVVRSVWRAPGFVYRLMCNAQDGDKDNQAWSWARTPPENALLPPDNTTWQSQDTPFVWDGVQFCPGRTHVFWAGDRHVMYGARKNVSTTLDLVLPALAYFGGWTERSCGDVSPGTPWGVYALDPLWSLWWHTAQGEPDVPTGSRWVAVTAGGGAVDLTMDRLRITGSAPGDIYRYAYNPGAIGGPGWGFGSGAGEPAVFRWVMSLDAGDSTLTADDVAVRVQGTDTANANHWDVSLRITGSTVRIVDNEAAGATLLDITGLSIDNGEDGPYTEFRLVAINNAGAVTLQLALRELDDELVPGAWVEGASVTPTVTAFGATPLRLQWGHLGQVQATQMRSYWREFPVAEGAQGQTFAQQQFQFANPTDLLGEVCAADEGTLLRDGMSVRWAGVSGVPGDTFVGQISHTSAVEYAWTIDSPRLGWRSTSQAAQTIIFDADPGGTGLRRWSHDAVALFGTNGRRIDLDYDNDPGFGSPVGAVTLDAALYNTTANRLEVGAVPAGSVRLDLDATSLLDRFKPGALVGAYVRPVSGGAAGQTWKVTRHPRLLELWFDDEATSLATQGLSVGDKLVVFGDRVAATDLDSQNQRYMRLRFVDADTAEGDHALGAFVPGDSFYLDVPVDWAFTDNEQPNNTDFRTRGAVSWTYQEGPPQRVVVGRIVGDARRVRQELRSRLRNQGYNATPLALCFDDHNANLQLVIGRITSGSQHDNAGWRPNPLADLPYTVGDQSLTFTEEP